MTPYLKHCGYCFLQKPNLAQIPSLDYSNDEDLNEDTRLMYEKYSSKMDESKFVFCNIWTRYFTIS